MAESSACVPLLSSDLSRLDGRGEEWSPLSSGPKDALWTVPSTVAFSSKDLEKEHQWPTYTVHDARLPGVV